MTNQCASEESRPFLTPDAIHPPPPTPHPVQRYRDNDASDSDDSTGAEFRITPIVVFRAIIIILTFSNIILQLVSYPRLFAAIMLIIITFITFF